MIEDIMTINVDNLAKRQFEAYKTHVIEVLDDIKLIIKLDKYDELDRRIFYSRGGGHGESNYCINFGWTGKNIAISEAGEILYSLHSIVKGENNGERKEP
jgi:hypothetical protein